MYISLNWLKEYIKIPAKITPAKIAEELTSHTVEVEGFVNQAKQFENVVVGKVLEVKKHPNADRLRLVNVDIKTQKLDIVCGAPNIAVDQLVPVALVGAILPNGLEIKESVIRGEKSSGMICAEDELGLGKNHEGIMVLKSTAKIGELFSKYIKVDDVIFEIDNKSLSNRPDLLNHYGIARELSVIFDLPLKEYEKSAVKKSNFIDKADNELEVKIDDQESCLRYLAVRVGGIEVKESPDWLKSKLIAIGQRPINNIVDLTNYVMFDCGQPMHAFDGDKVPKIAVRKAKRDEIIETLDEKEKVLNESDLIITDGKKPIAIAGIMGGKNSEIDSGTNKLILESANFLASSIRKTSQKLGLRTEASVRFEKSLDINLAKIALDRFLNLLKELCPNLVIESSITDINQIAVEEKDIELNLNWLAKKIGQEINQDIVVKILTKLGFRIKSAENGLLVSVPSWRATKDINTREDLAEEVLRLYGYNNIEARLPVLMLNLPLPNQERLLERKIKQFLSIGENLNEAYNYSFVSDDQLNKLSIESSNHLRLANPLSDMYTILRQSLIPGLALNIKTNQAKEEKFGFFEIGNVFFNTPGNLVKDTSGDQFLPYQEKHLGLALIDADDSFGKLKSVINNLFLNIINHEAQIEYLVADSLPGWSDKQLSAKILVFGEEVGFIGLLDRITQKNINLKRSSALAEINFYKLAAIIFKTPLLTFKEIPKYPAVMRDLAFVVNNKILYNDLRNHILNFNPLLRSALLFDVYSGDKLASDQKSLAFRLTYRADDRTLLASEVDAIQSDLVKYLEDRFEAKLRDF